MAVIGSVSVEVVPDARGFVGKMQAQLLPEADRLGRELGKRIGDPAGRVARERIDAQLKGLKAKVNVDADTTKARAEIAALNKAANKVPGKGPGLLLTAILGLGPALVPLGAIAAASFGAIAEGAGVAFLAFEGIKDQMKVGSQLGKAYASGLDSVKDVMEHLSVIAAQGVFTGFQSSVKDITRLLPGLSRSTALFANALGEAGSHVVHGLLAGFIKLQPLMDDLLGIGIDLSKQFDTFASGSGLQKFGDWAQANLPVIQEDIAAISKAIEKLLVASASTGINLLTVLASFGRALDAIPLGVLQVMVPLVSSLLLAWKGYAIVSGIIYSVNKAMLANAAAATAMAAANKEAAAAGGVVAGRGGGKTPIPPLLFGGGPIGILGGLAVGGAVVHSALDTQAKKPGLLGQIANALISTPGLKPAHQPQFGALLPDQKKAVSAADALTAANARLAAGLGTTADATLVATDASTKQVAAQKLQTEVMVQTNDAAGLLAKALASLGGNNLGVAEATTNLNESQKALTASLKTNGAAIKGSSDKAIANQHAFQANAKAAIDLATAVEQNTGSTLKGNAAMAKARDKAIAQANATLIAEGATRAQIKAVDDYINSIYKIPRRRLTEADFKILGQKKLDDFKAQLAALHSFAITVTANVVKGGAVVYGHPILPAAGGVFPGYAPGQDTISTVVSPGEGVLVPEAVRGLGGPKAIYNINKAYAPRVAGHQSNYGFAAGGAVGYKRTPGTLTAYDSTAAGMITGLKAATPIIAAAVRDLSRAVVDAVDLKGAEGKLTAARQKLQNLQTASAQLATSVSGTLGIGDVAGAGSSSGFSGGITSIIGAFQAQSATDKQFLGQINTLKAKGLSKSLLSQYGQAGPSQALAILAQSTPGQIHQLNLANAQLLGLQGAAGRAVAGAVYGSDIRQAAAAVRHESATVAVLTRRIDNLATAVQRLTGRPVEVTLDGRVIARAVARRLSHSGKA